jgi:hypothetical protein
MIALVIIFSFGLGALALLCPRLLDNHLPHIFADLLGIEL